MVELWEKEQPNKKTPRPKKLNIIGAKKFKWTIFKEEIKNIFRSKKNKNVNNTKIN